MHLHFNSHVLEELPDSLDALLFFPEVIVGYKCHTACQKMTASESER